MRAYQAMSALDKTIRVYRLKLDELIALARSRLTRLLAPDERRKYLHVDKCP